MIRCPSCKRLHGSESPTCEHCGYHPQIVNSRPAWAPELAFQNEGFKPEYFGELARLEAGNFWFRSRNALLTWAIRRYFGSPRSFLEVGCGTGYVLSSIAAAHPDARMVGSEVFNAGLDFAAQRVPRAAFVQMDARDIPYEDEFDVVGAFDVIEHIEDAVQWADATGWDRAEATRPVRAQQARSPTPVRSPPVRGREPVPELAMGSEPAR